MATQQEITSRLLSVLSNLKEGKGKSLLEISKESETHPNTIENKLREIVMIQNFPKIDLIESKYHIIVIKKPESEVEELKPLIKKLLKKLERKRDEQR